MPVADQGTVRVGGNADGDRRQRVALHVAPPVTDLDVAARRVLWRVQIRGQVVPRVGDLVSHVFGHISRDDGREVIAADVTYEPVRCGVIHDRFSRTTSQQLDRLISAEEPVVVVEGLEVIEVDVEESEGLLTGDALDDLLLDLRVTGKP